MSHWNQSKFKSFILNFFQPDPDRGGDNNSDSGSFHASVWEEERSKRSLVKWAGEDALDLDKTGNLRRAPTPFPKEMRAMAKKVQNMKEKKAIEDERNSKRRSTREFRSRNGRSRVKEIDEFDRSHPVHHHQQQQQQSAVVASQSAENIADNQVKDFRG